MHTRAWRGFCSHIAGNVFYVETFGDIKEKSNVTIMQTGLSVESNVLVYRWRKTRFMLEPQHVLVLETNSLMAADERIYGQR